MNVVNPYLGQCELGVLSYWGPIQESGNLFVMSQGSYGKYCSGVRVLSQSHLVGGYPVWKVDALLAEVTSEEGAGDRVLAP